MSDFWKTPATFMLERGSGYKAFSLFGPVHLAELGVGAAFLVLCCFGFARLGKAGRRRALVLLTAVMLADEVVKYLGSICTGQWIWSYLPLHLCSINIFVCLYNTLTDRRWPKEVLYLLGLPGALIALLSPGWQAAPVWNLMHLHSVTIHLFLMLYPLLLLVDGYRPDPKYLPGVLGFLIGAAIPIYFLNKVLGTNFFFINGTDNNALASLLAGIFGADRYLLGYPLILAAVIALMYAPWLLAGRRRKTAK